jgi:hypothetical protein
VTRQRDLAIWVWVTARSVATAMGRLLDPPGCPGVLPPRPTIKTSVTSSRLGQEMLLSYPGIASLAYSGSNQQFPARHAGQQVQDEGFESDAEALPGKPRPDPENQIIKQPQPSGRIYAVARGHRVDRPESPRTKVVKRWSFRIEYCRTQGRDLQLDY